MDFKKTIFVLPNLLTAASLFCGMLAITRCIGAKATQITAMRTSINADEIACELFRDVIID